MIGVFACPECGAEVRPIDRTPGRQVRCGHCSTLVEVPFLPRSVSWGRRIARARRRRSRRVAIILMAIVAVALLGGFWLRSRARSARHLDLVALVDESRGAEEQGRIGPAFHAIQAAVLLAESRRLTPPEGMDALRSRRDALARRDLEARLARLDELGAYRAIGEALILRQLARDDPALAALAGRVQMALDSTFGDWLDARRTAADSALCGGRLVEVLGIAEQMLGLAEALPPGLGGRAREAARELASGAVAQGGVVLGTPDYAATLPYHEPYEADLRPLLNEALERHGFLPRPDHSPFREFWDDAPFRVDLHLKEGPGPAYLQSPHATSRIELQFELFWRDQRAWNGLVAARTRNTLGSPEASRKIRFGLGNRANTAVEQILYADARDDLLVKLASKLEAMPRRESLTGALPVGSRGPGASLGRPLLAPHPSLAEGWDAREGA